MTYPGYNPSGQQPGSYGYATAGGTSSTVTPASRRAGVAVLASALLLLLLGGVMIGGIAQLDAAALFANNPDIPAGQEQAYKTGSIALCSGCAFVMLLPLFILFPFVRSGRKGATITAIVFLALALLILGVNAVGGIIQLAIPDVAEGPALPRAWIAAQLVLSVLALLASVAALILCAMALRSSAAASPQPGQAGYYPPGGYAGAGYSQPQYGQPPYDPSQPPQQGSQQGWGQAGGYPGSEPHPQSPPPQSPPPGDEDENQPRP